MSRLREAITELLSAIAPAPGPRLSPWLKGELSKAPLTVIDVGPAIGARSVSGGVLADQSGPLLRHLYRARQRQSLERSCITDPL